MSQQWHVPGYAEVRELGTGGGGTVVEAMSPHGDPVAVKYLAADLLADRAFRDAFRAEARLLCDLDSPHVVRLHEYVECAVGAAIVMELVDGPSLRSLLADRGPVEPEAALALLKGALLGLGAAHASGVVHRDVKPANILVGPDGSSRLADFGVAARSGGATDGSGTPAYMPPEQWQGGPASPRGDVYSATATFVECLTGRPPYPSTDLATLRDQHLHAAVPTGVLPEPVQGLALHGLAKHPADRPADAASFLEELERAAVEGYGEDWEERGRDSLGRRASLLLLLLRAAAPVAGTAIGATVLGGAARRLPIAVLSGAAAAAIAVGVFMVGEPDVGPVASPTQIVGSSPASGAPGGGDTAGAPDGSEDDPGGGTGGSGGSDGSGGGSGPGAPSGGGPSGAGPSGGGGPGAADDPDDPDGSADDPGDPDDGRPDDGDDGRPGRPDNGRPGDDGRPGRPDNDRPDNGRPDDGGPGRPPVGQPQGPGDPGPTDPEPPVVSDPPVVPEPSDPEPSDPEPSDPEPPTTVPTTAPPTTAPPTTAPPTTAPPTTAPPTTAPPTTAPPTTAPPTTAPPTTVPPTGDPGPPILTIGDSPLGLPDLPPGCVLDEIYGVLCPPT